MDLKVFEGRLPYASELFGIYQPLLGWKSRRIHSRLSEGLLAYRGRFVSQLAGHISPQFTLADVSATQMEFQLRRGVPSASGPATTLPWLDSVVGWRVAELVQQAGAADPVAWRKYTSAESLDEILASSRDQIVAEYASGVAPLTQDARTAGLVELTFAHSILARESIVAGVLASLNNMLAPEQLRDLLINNLQPRLNPAAFLATLDWVDPDRAGLNRATLSPIAVVHLFRQYFFEFDSFLGPPVQHVWLSPGGTVELIEVSTRKSTIERTTEQAFETVATTEHDSTVQDELSDAIHQDNSSDTKLGVSANQSFTYGVAAFVKGSTSVNSTFNLDQQQKTGREQTHKSLRQQTEKASTQIRQSFKSTFRTVTETTDLNSKRYVLQNNTAALMNYELRRKMRQVGVQVQDYGSQLCWQTYVDEPGAQLGIARLVHIAQPSDLQPVKDPDLLPTPEPEIAASPQNLSAEWIWEDSQGGPPPKSFVPYLGTIQAVPPKPGYIYSRVDVVRVSGESWAYEARPRDANDAMGDTLYKPDVQNIDDGAGGTEPSVRSVQVGVHTDNSGLRTSAHPTNTVQVTLYFKPSRKLLADTAAENNKRIQQVNEEKARQYQAALFAEARDRIKAASKIDKRNSDDLRDEERTVVYRVLISQLIGAAGVALTNTHLQHLFSELVESIFDVDRMLYFVAPEWWVPRERGNSPQNVALPPDQAGAFAQQQTVDWGGPSSSRPDNYYITEDSVPAAKGSSLGWVLQLDGDNLRNAFLNAPWVKAVLPIRPMQEWKALQWLSSDAIEGADGLDSLYDASGDAERTAIIARLRAYAWSDPALTARYAALAPADITIMDALRWLIIRIQDKEAKSNEKIPDPIDPGVSYLPSDRVFEHGFDPLAGGFQAEVKEPFEVFDAWVEVLPTDQIVPVEVSYDPKTGRLRDPA